MNIRRTYQDHDPAYWQQFHSPTEAEEVKVGHAGRTQVSKTQRRIVDARLWNSLSPAQQEAAECIAAGFRILTQGLGMKVASHERADQSKRDYWNRAEETVVAGYWDWQQEMRKERRNPHTIIMVLVEGHTLSDMDRMMRSRKGTMRGLLVAALDLY